MPRAAGGLPTRRRPPQPPNQPDVFPVLTHQPCHADARCQLRPLVPSLRRAAPEVAGSRHAVGTSLGHWSGWRIDINACSGGGSCLEVTYRRFILVLPKRGACDVVPHSWYEAIDPDSYYHGHGSNSSRGNSKTVKANDGLPCRDDLRCANYYRYLERPIVRKCGKLSTGCEQSCSRPVGSTSPHNVPLKQFGRGMSVHIT